MSVAASPCETAGPHDASHGPSNDPRHDPMASIRVIGGGATASFIYKEGATRIATLAERGGYRLKFPDTPGPALEAVLVNTGGGVAGGDQVQLDLTAGPATHVTLSTVSAERIYRALGASARIDVTLSAGPEAVLAWLPQATILFSGARLERRFAIDLAPTSSLVIGEITLFGRAASGETMGRGLLDDRWRIRRDGRTILAEATKLDGDIGALLARPAVAAGTRGMALLVVCALGIAERVDAVRAALDEPGAPIGGGTLGPGTWGVSAWDDILVMRALADDLETLQAAVRRVIVASGIARVPHTWST